MKIALCFSGMLRTAFEASPNLLNFIHTTSHEIDVFIHTWDISQDRAWDTDKNPHLQQRPITNIYEPHLKKLGQIYNVKSYQIENFSDYLKNTKARLEGPSPHDLFYSWDKSVRLMTQYENKNNIKYDVCVKLRFDVIFDRNVKLEASLEHYRPSVFFITNSTEARIDDVIWFSEPNIARTLSKYYGYCIDNLKYIHFVDYVRMNNIETKNIDICPYTIYRTEALHLDPVNNFNQCFNIERDFYAPATTTERLPLDE